MPTGQKRDPAVDAVSRIIKDLTDRQGIGDEFEACDAEIRREIIRTWRDIIRETYREMIPREPTKETSTR